MTEYLNVALYARVSSQKQADEKTIQSQVQELRERIAFDGQRIVSELEFCDDGYSGAELLRPGLERLRDRIALDVIERLYIHSPDRLARKSAHQAILMEEFKQRQVEVVFLNQAELANTAETNLLIQMQGVIAEYEREKIIERTRRGRKYSAKAGNVNVFGGAPYGYNYIKKSEGQAARWEIHPVRSEHVKVIFHLVVQQRYSLSKVVNYLSEHSIPTLNGNARWDTATIRGILQNPAYHGTAVFGKTQLLARQTPSPRKKGSPAVPRRAKVARERVDGEKFEIAVPAIIDRELFNQAQIIMDRNRKQQRERQVNTQYLLSGLLTCGTCGSAYCARRNGDGGKYFTYRCIGTDKYRRQGKDLCTATSIKGALIEGLVWQEVTQLLEDPSRIRHELLQRASQSNVNEQQVDRLTQTVKTTQQRMNRLIDAYETALITKDEFQNRIVPLRDRFNRERQELDTITNASQQLNVNDAAAKLETFAKTVSEKLATANWELRRQLCKLLVERIEVSDKELHITYKVPQNPFVLSPANGDFVQHCLSRHSVARGEADGVSETPGRLSRVTASRGATTVSQSVITGRAG